MLKLWPSVQRFCGLAYHVVPEWLEPVRSPCILPLIDGHYKTATVMQCSTHFKRVRLHESLCRFATMHGRLCAPKQLFRQLAPHDIARPGPRASSAGAGSRRGRERHAPCYGGCQRRTDLGIAHDERAREPKRPAV